MGQAVTQACRQATELRLDVHLMVEHPDRMLRSFAEAGADHIHVHVEASPHIHRSLQTIQELGCKAGVAINPGTAIETVLPLLELADIFLIMSVNPGYSGQDFLAEVLPKVRLLRTELDKSKSKALIEFDGGIDADTLPAALEAGGRVFVAGNAVFKHSQGIAAGMKALQTAALEPQH
jgi:ribulose-phosphate 3-epimerase